MSLGAVPAVNLGIGGPASRQAPSFFSGLLFGLRGRLLLAFVAISLFVMAAAAAGLYAVGQIGHTLDRITTQSVPMALQARELSRKSEKLVSAGVALENAADGAQVEELANDAMAEL